MKKIFLQLLVLLIVQHIQAQSQIDKIEPPFWWAGMKTGQLQLKIYGKDLQNCTANLDTNGLKVIDNLHPDKDHWIINLNIANGSKPGLYKLRIDGGPSYMKNLVYELKERRYSSENRTGISQSDAIFQFIPDQLSPVQDFNGISNKLEFIRKLGFTVFTTSSVLDRTNSIIDYYSIASKMGSNNDYCSFVNSAHKQGIKVIFEVVPDISTTEYLIQNTLWWIEFANLDGILLNTSQKPGDKSINSFIQKINNEFPKFSVINDFPNSSDIRFSQTLQKAFTEEDDQKSALNQLFKTLSDRKHTPGTDNFNLFTDNQSINNTANVKMALAFVSTIPGKPWFKYASIKEEISSEEKEKNDYITNLLNWRLHNPAALTGDLLQHPPIDGIYVYFRTLPNQALMVLLNNNTSEAIFKYDPYKETLQGFKRSKDALSQQNVDLKGTIKIPAKSVRIIELNK